MVNVKIKVYKIGTNEDVTNEQEWYIDTTGDLFYMTNDIDSPLYMPSDEYYYKLEIEMS
jgi:hypothetical protein